MMARKNEEYYLFSFQMMYKSQFQKIDPYDWFCGPGSQMSYSNSLIKRKNLTQKIMHTFRKIAF